MDRVRQIQNELSACQSELSWYLGAAESSKPNVLWDEVMNFFKGFKKLVHTFTLDEEVKQSILSQVEGFSIEFGESVRVSYPYHGGLMCFVFYYDINDSVIKVETQCIIDSPYLDRYFIDVKKITVATDLIETMARFLKPVNRYLDASGLAQLFVRAYFQRRSDVLYDDGDVCILKPGAVGGMVVFHFVAPENVEQVRKSGLCRKNEEAVWFRAPALRSNERMEWIPRVKEINSNYPGGEGVKRASGKYVCIRIDPKRTYVYSNIARNENWHGWLTSRRALYDYISTLASNRAVNDVEGAFNALTYEAVDSRHEGVFETDGRHFKRPYTNYPMNINAVILVDRDIPAEWFVKYF